MLGHKPTIFFFFLFFFFWETSIMFLVFAPIYIPTSNVQGFSFLHILANICYQQFFVFVFFFFLNRYEVIAHCGFDLHFPGYQWCWVSFMCLLAISMSSLKKSLSSSAHFLSGCFFFNQGLLNKQCSCLWKR